MANLTNWGKSLNAIISAGELSDVVSAINTALKAIDTKFAASASPTIVTDGIEFSYDGTVLGAIESVVTAYHFQWTPDGTNKFTKGDSENRPYCLGMIANWKSVAIVMFTASSGGYAKAAVIFTLDDGDEPLVLWNNFAANDDFSETSVYTENASGAFSNLTVTVSHSFSNSCCAFPPAVYNTQTYAKSVFWMICNPLQNGEYAQVTLNGANYYAIGSFLMKE